MADPPASEHNGSSPWSQRGFVLAAAFVVGLVLIGLVLLLVAPGGDDDSNGQSSQNAPAPAPARQDPNSSVCGLPAGRQQVPAVPPKAEWELVGTIAAPTEPNTLGPGVKRGKLRACYAHSPAGALFAAANFIAVTSAATDAPEVFRELTAAGAARDASLRENARSTDEGSGGGLQVSGFRISSYSSNEATVDLAFAVAARSAQGYVRLALPLRWERGDWKVVVTTPQGPFAGYERLENLSGYVPWSGT